jgi:hypothetical protein
MQLQLNLHITIIKQIYVVHNVMKVTYEPDARRFARTNHSVARRRHFRSLTSTGPVNVCFVLILCR